MIETKTTKNIDTLNRRRTFKIDELFISLFEKTNIENEIIKNIYALSIDLPSEDSCLR